MTSLAEFRAKFLIDDLAVVTTAYWTWSVRPVQTTLGAGILSLNRLCPAMGELTAHEGRDLASVVGAVERGTRAAFGADKFNYLTYMMNDHHVHTHVLPRYATAPWFAGVLFVDDAWPRPTAATWDAASIDLDLLAAIRDALRAGA